MQAPLAQKFRIFNTGNEFILMENLTVHAVVSDSLIMGGYLLQNPSK